MSRGNGGLDKWTDERQPNAGRVELTKWRSQVEKPVLSCMSHYSTLSFNGKWADNQPTRSTGSSSDLEYCMEDQDLCLE